MSKKNKKKKVVVTKKEKTVLQPTQSKQSTKAGARSYSSDLLYGRKNYILLAVSFGLILFGMLLMAGGHQLPTEWNENEIYSFRRTVLAPIVILIGLGVGLMAILSKKA